MLKSENYVVIQGWMCNELNLKGNDLLVYALIYGFSQDGDSVFSGGRNYIAKTFNISLPTVDKALNNLVESGLIEKLPIELNNVTFNHYKVSLGVVKKLYGGSKETLPNNIINNKNNKINISKDILISEPASDFKFGTEMNPPKKTNVSEYDLAIKMVSEYTNDSMLKSELNKFVRLRKEMASKSKYHFYSSMIKNYLDELSKTFGNDDRAKIEAVRLSIRYNCTTKVMIPNTHFGDVSSSIEGFVSPDTSNDGLNHNRAVDENGNPLMF